MKKYTEAQVRELAKMGVIVTTEGKNLTKETQLEKTMRIKAAK